jgi:hypothetical protein
MHILCTNTYFPHDLQFSRKLNEREIRLQKCVELLANFLIFKIDVLAITHCVPVPSHSYVGGGGCSRDIWPGPLAPNIFLFNLKNCYN